VNLAFHVEQLFERVSTKSGPEVYPFLESDEKLVRG